LTVPEIEKSRYYSVQFIDMYTFNFAYMGSRATGNGAGSYLLAGPGWKGEKPKGIKQVIRSETEFAFALIRTQLFDPADIEKVKAIQAGYKVEPLSQFLGQPAPAAAPAVDFLKPLSPEQERSSLDFFNVLNFVSAILPAQSGRAGDAGALRQNRRWRRQALRRECAVAGDAPGARRRHGGCLESLERLQGGRA
jgi:hypothetical protein